jgi:hypothetical protein
MMRWIRRLIFWLLGWLDSNETGPHIYERPPDDAQDSAELAELIWRHHQEGPH